MLYKCKIKLKIKVFWFWHVLKICIIDLSIRVLFSVSFVVSVLFYSMKHVFTDICYSALIVCLFRRWMLLFLITFFHLLQFFGILSHFLYPFSPLIFIHLNLCSIFLFMNWVIWLQITRFICLENTTKSLLKICFICGWLLKWRFFLFFILSFYFLFL